MILNIITSTVTKHCTLPSLAFRLCHAIRTLSSACFHEPSMPRNRRVKRSKDNGGRTKSITHPPGLRGKEIGLWYAALHNSGKSSNSLKTIPLDITGINPMQIREAIDHYQALQNECRIGNVVTRRMDYTEVLSKRTNPIEFATDTISARAEEDDPGLNLEEVEELIDTMGESLDVSVPGVSQYRFGDPIASTGETLCRLPELDRLLLDQLREQQASTQYLAMLSGRQKLPVYAYQRELLEAIDTNQAVVISGATGCGKTTQIPQFILEDQISRGKGSTTRIVVTQPRRISAISVAERVAAERGEEIGQSIGYQVRLEHQFPKRRSGSIMYCTTGIVLQSLQSDPLLKTVSHIVVDEVHERECLTDFLLTLLRRIRTTRPDLRIILMSATLNADKFSSYFDNCPKLDIPGRLHHVETFFLEDVLRMTNFWLPDAAMRELAKTQNAYLKRRHIDTGLSRTKSKSVLRQTNASFNAWIAKQENLSPKAKDILRTVNEDAYPNTDLIVHLIDYIIQTTQDGAILVFVPGIGAIKDTIRGLQDLNPRFYSQQSPYVRIYPLHSHLATSRQKGLFELPPTGQRKIVISTNIAETSVTIEDVVYVIDCGRIKITDYDPACNTYSLAPVLVSKANAAQRRGRAGRVRPGVCYHLFSQYVHDSTMDEFLSPELLRMRLEDVILRIKVLNLGSVTDFLSNCMDPPSRDAVERSLHFLYELQTLSPRQNRLELTPEGEIQSLSSNGDKKRTRRQLKEIANQATKDAQAGLLRPEGYSTVDDVLLGDVEPLNALGKQLALLPLDPQCGKLLLLGAIFACLEPALIVAACLSYRDPFEIPMERETQAYRRRLELSQNTLSDHWVLVTIMQNFRQLTSTQSRRQFCAEYFLRENVMFEILRLMKDYAQILYEHNYINSPKVLDRAANMNKNNFTIFRAILCGALYPNILRMGERDRDGVILRPKYIGRPSEGFAAIHSKSVNSLVWPKEPLWMVYFSKTRMENSLRPTITDSTIATLRTLLFFGGPLTRRQEGHCTLTIGDWIQVQVEPKVATLLKDLRDKLDHFLLTKFKQPTSTNWDPNSAEGFLLQTIFKLLAEEPGPRVHTKSFGGFNDRHNCKPKDNRAGRQPSLSQSSEDNGTN